MGSSKSQSGKAKPQSRACVLDANCIDDLQWWVSTQSRTATRILELIEHVLRDPFAGIGKPEPLKGLGPNTWSRRITAEHRLVYAVFDDRIVFLQARYHY